MALINPSMIADFTACGGIIMLATGFRLCGIRAFPTANMLPSLILVMPFSAAGSSLSPETLSFFAFASIARILATLARPFASALQA
nr:Protein of uncharacterised function (DUF554) [Klebsiella pneumoniae]